MNFVEVKNLISRYKIFSGERQEPKVLTVLDDVSLSIKAGDFVGILGHNGSGKSTLARQLSALLKPAGGVIYIKGMDTADDSLTYQIRKTAGIVFQNPENQIIGATVEEDVAFGMENLGLAREEMDKRIGEILASLDLTACRMASPDVLSGGQKQKVALSGILAMEPACIIFDEPTSMLDPAGRQEVMDAVRFLNKERGITIIYITHHADEVEDADYLYLMKEGRVALSGTGPEVWSHTDEVSACGVGLPFVRDLIRRLGQAGLQIPAAIMGKEELVDYLCRQMSLKKADTDLEKTDLKKTNLQGVDLQKIDVEKSAYKEDHIEKATFAQKNDPDIVFDHVSYSYWQAKQDPDHYALKDINLSIAKGEFIGIAGRTGSGKSTLVQLLNGLLFPTKGTCYYKGEDITDKKFPIKKLRQKAGLCMQYPEHQLFEETVLKDIAFGPSNMGYDKKAALEKARKAMELTGLPEEISSHSPFTLSGGQKRRVALAGILSMEPDYLILDEPAAGLDLAGKEKLFSLLRDLNEKEGISIIMVSHDMNDLASLAQRVLVLKEGEILADASTADVFSNKELLKSAGLEQPDPILFWDRLQAGGFTLSLKTKGLGNKPGLTQRPLLTIEELVEQIVGTLKEDESWTDL